MRILLYALSIAAVVGLAFWSYRESYETRATAREVAQLQREVGQRHRELAMLRTEWAYLNRPDRLHALTEMNFERLELMALTADHFALTEQVAYPAPVEILPPLGPELEAELGDVIVMNHRAERERGARVVPPPTLAEDGEMLP